MMFERPLQTEKHEPPAVVGGFKLLVLPIFGAEKPLCTNRSSVFPPRASSVHSISAKLSFEASFFPGSQATISASPSQFGPHDKNIFPPTPGVTRASSGNHLTSSFDSVSAFHTYSSSVNLDLFLEFSLRLVFFELRRFRHFLPLQKCLRTRNENI
jgi:hypothetical protein